MLKLYHVLRYLLPFVQFKNVKNTHGGMSLVVKLHAYITYGDIKEVMSTQIILTIF